jgi:predicted Zn-dependent peptidase
MRTKRAILSLAVVLVLAGASLAQQSAAPKKQEPARTPGAAAPAKAAQPSQAVGRPSSYKALKYPPLNKIQAPQPARFELPNGMVVYLVEDHEIPMISISSMIHAGSLWEPGQKAGLASIAGAVMRSGGTSKYPGDRLDEELDRLGAYVETGMGQDSGNASVSVLKEDIDRGISILADLLQNPAFPQDKIDIAKIAERDEVARRNDNPHSIVFREFNRVIYGKDSPYARLTEYDTINSITRDDLVAFHKQFIQPENIILGVVGDFKADEMRAKIEKAFGSWPRGGKPKPRTPEVDPAARGRAGFYSVNKEDMQQSWVIMGMLAGRRDDPDYCALDVMNGVLGGGFASRLFSNVRSDQGLAYAVFSSWDAGWDQPGTFTAAGSTKPETTIKIYNSIRHEIERLAEGGVTDDELSRSKDGILKGMAFESDSTAKIVRRMMSYEYHGYPPDFLEKYRAGVEKTTKADVARAAKQYLKPDQFAVLFLGKEKGYEQPLASLGKVASIDISIPSPKREALAAATPESTAKGRALLAAAREAMGGAALMNVKDYTAVGEVKVETPQGPMAIKYEGTMNLAGKMLQKMQTPMGEMVIGYDGKAGWMRMGQQTQDLPASQAAESEGSFFRDTILLLRNFENSAYAVQALGPEEVEGKKVEGVAVSDAARKLQVKVYVDPATNLIVGKQYVAAIMGPPAETEEMYSDYREIAGIKMPFKTVTKQGGKTRTDSTASEIKINPGVNDNAYKKP